MNRQLVLVRQFFDDARRSPSAQTTFVRMRRTLHLDLCVELSLGAVVVDHGKPDAQAKMARADLKWKELWDAADDAANTKLGNPLPGGQALRTLHEQRNLAQHRGSIPSTEDIERHVEPVRALLNFVCREFYQREFEQLEEWDVLECEPLREWLANCAAAIGRDAPELAIRAAVSAYTAIVRTVQLTVAGPMPSAGFPRQIMVKDRDLLNALKTLTETFNTFQRGLVDTLLAVEGEIMAVGLGLPIVDHIRFLRCTRGHLNDRVGDARFMTHYLAKAAVMLESAVPGVFDSLRLPKFPSSET